MPLSVVFVPPAAIFIPAMEPRRRSARMAEGSRVVKSLSKTTTSLISGAAGGSRMIKGAVSIDCS